MKTLTRSTPILLALVLGACGGETASEPSSAAAAVASLPERYLLQAAPGDVQDVGVAHEGVAEGETVTVRGVVGGSRVPFVAGLAAFTIVDPGLESCAKDDMGCKTPWDYCCVDPQTIAENSVTVEFREGDATLAANPRGFHGIDHLATIVVEGVAERDPQGNVTIVASGVRVLDD